MRSMSRRARRTALVAVPVALGLLVGCGSQSADNAESTTSSSSASPTPASPTPATPEPPTSSSATSAGPSTSSSSSSSEGRPSTTQRGSSAPEETSSSTPGATSGTPSSDSPSSTPSQSPSSDGTTSSTTAPETTVLAVGASGPRVSGAQERLQQLGYFGVTADGQFGGSTRQAVWALQKAAGLPRTGRIDAGTQQALDRGVVPNPRSSGGKVVEIDLDRQLVVAVENGRVRSVLNASSGNGERFTVKDKKTGAETSYTARTPRGSFSVYREENKKHESTLELGSMWRPKYFDGAIAVHGSGSVPPHAASHGCVRVTNAAMNWLWDSWGMPIGTRVLVY